MAQNRANINLSGQVLQTYLKRQVLKNFEPNLKFHQLGEKPAREDGYNTLAWTRLNRISFTPTQALLTEGITPAEKAFDMTTVTLSPTQYGMYITLSDFLLDVSPVNIFQKAGGLIGDNLARIVDEVIQEYLSTNGVNVQFSGNVANRAALGAANTLTTQDLAKAAAYLSVKAAPTYDGSYVAIMHPNVVYDLQVETGSKSWVDVNKYNPKTVTKIFSGEIGTIFGVRVIQSAFVLAFASTVQVFPTYVLGQGAYGVASLVNMSYHVTMRKTTDSDPLAQRAKTGAKCTFGVIILQEEALIRIESASALSATFL